VLYLYYRSGTEDPKPGQEEEGGIAKLWHLNGGSS